MNASKRPGMKIGLRLHYREMVLDRTLCMENRVPFPVGQIALEGYNSIEIELSRKEPHG